MSAPFTPGPWTFDGPTSSRIVWAGPEDRVCFMTSDGPNLANAHLIAAAPELYEALSAIDAMWSENLEPGEGPEAARSEAVRTVWKELRAALQKARGEML